MTAPLLTCQVDSYQRTIDATVLACEPVPNGFRVHTDATILYPGGGGQPADGGTIGAAQVVEVIEDRVYRVDTQVPCGPVTIAVDWNRRFDHMQQHTAQHLITAVAIDLFGIETTAFHLNPDRSDVVLATPTLSADQIEAIADRVHAHIRAATPVHPKLVDPTNLDGVRYRRLPPGHTGPLRVVEIEGVDQNTCGGTHVANLAELQLVHFLGAEKSKGETRLHWLAGNRALRWMRAANTRTKALNQILRTQPAEHIDAATRLTTQNRDAARETRALRTELATAIGATLTPDQRWFHRDDADMAFLNAVAKAAPPRPQLLLTGGAQGEGVFIVVGKEVDPALGPKIAEILQGRGGGRGRYQGKAKAIEHRAKAAKLLN